MKDRMLIKLTSQKWFKKLSPQERAIELHDYNHQKRNFNREVTQ